LADQWFSLGRQQWKSLDSTQKEAWFQLLAFLENSKEAKDQETLKLMAAKLPSDFQGLVSVYLGAGDAKVDHVRHDDFLDEKLVGRLLLFITSTAFLLLIYSFNPEGSPIPTPVVTILLLYLKDILLAFWDAQKKLTTLGLVVVFSFASYLFPLLLRFNSRKRHLSSLFEKSYSWL
jgi:hypothetical protein